MSTQYLTCPDRPQVFPYDAEQIAQGLTRELAHYLYPLLVRLDQLLDKRLVRTFAQLIDVILIVRDRPNGLLLTELGNLPACSFPFLFLG